MKSPNLFDGIVKTVKKNYKFILILLFIVIILLFVFNMYYDRNERFTNPDVKATNINPASGVAFTRGHQYTPRLYGNYIDYSVISPVEIYSTTKDNITSITYKLSSVVQVESIGFNNDNGASILPNNITVNLSIINPDGKTEQIGDIGIDGTASTTPTTDITIKNSDITNSYTSIIRKARTVKNVSAITDTVIITATGTNKLPCKFLTYMCFFGKAEDDLSESDLYRKDIGNSEPSQAIKMYSTSSEASPAWTKIGNKEVFELAFMNDSANLTQISARFIILKSYINLYKTAPASLDSSTRTNCDVTTKPNYITATVSYKNDVLNNADLILPTTYKLVPFKETATNVTFYYYYIFLPVPLIMNSIKISYDTSSTNNRFDHGVDVIGRLATTTDLDDYNNYVDNNTSGSSASGQSRETMNSLDVCPSDISEIIKIQKTTQDICENIEYQDKIKAEKAKLEREKVYLVKLKTQFDEIKSLQDTINTLDARKQQRNENADSVRLLQYQQQKAQAAQLRDAAINRASQYDKNQLYFDVNLEKTNA